MKPKVSIIIPCYNGEKYIKKCFDSITNSSYKNIEIIAVNNCSTDNTAAILKELSNESENIKYVECNLKGVSNARNEGIKFATGEYLQFVDCDDIVMPNCTQKLVETAVSSNSDLVISSFYQNNISTNEKSVYHGCLKAGDYTKKQFLKELSKDPEAHYYGVLWNKLYKSSFVKDKLFFDPKISLGEDFIFNLSYYSKCNKITAVEDKLYIYMYGVTDSLTNINKSEEERLNDRLNMYHSYKDFYDKEKLHGLWNLRLHFYIMRSYYNELEYLGSDSVKWEKVIFQKFIKDNNISNLEFKLYSTLRKIKQLLR